MHSVLFLMMPVNFTVWCSILRECTHPVIALLHFLYCVICHLVVFWCC